MGKQNTGTTVNQKKNKEYRFEKLPENIRQMGEQPEKDRIYIEDYVMTYIHQVFKKQQENAIVILVGKKGEGEAGDAVFVYGAIEIEMNILQESCSFNSETWNKIYELIYQHFQGGEILGWGCGVSLWNSRTDNVVRQIHKKHFSQEGKIFFMEDFSEKEEKIFYWKNGQLEELPGYVIYYEKNPQMQDYMLLGQPKKSFESSYHDKVTQNVRTVIQRKEVQKEPKKVAIYSAGVLLILLTILGANLLMQSTRKIDSLEKTIETLSNAATNVTEKPVSQDSKESEKVQAALRPKTELGEAITTGMPTAKPEATQEAAVTSDEKSEVTQEAVATPNIKSETAQGAVTPTTKPEVTQVVAATPTAKPSGKFVNKENTKASEPVKKSKTIQKSSEASKTVITSSYIVRAGDTLSQIVWRQYRTLAYMKRIKKVNHIEDGDKIKEGQRLLLPNYKEE